MTAATLLFTSCSNEPVKTTEAEAPSLNLDSIKATIVASNKVYGECFAKGDSATFVNIYASDAVLMAPNMPKMPGRAAIGQFFSGGYKMGMRNIKIDTDEIAGSKEGIIEIGRYEVLGDKNVSFDKGKFIVIWKEEGGKWKMYRDIFNSDAPPPVAPAK